MVPAELRHCRHKVIDGVRDAATGLVGGALATSPNIGRMFDLTHMLTKLREGALPEYAVAALVQEMLSVFCKRPVKLPCAHLPHLFHGILPFLAERKAGSPFIQGGKQAADDALHLRTWKHPDASLHDEVLVEEKDLCANACLVGRRIICARQLLERLSGRPIKTGGEQPGQFSSDIEIIPRDSRLCHRSEIPWCKTDSCTIVTQQPILSFPFRIPKTIHNSRREGGFAAGSSHYGLLG